MRVKDPVSKEGPKNLNPNKSASRLASSGKQVNSDENAALFYTSFPFDIEGTKFTNNLNLGIMVSMPSCLVARRVYS